MARPMVPARPGESVTDATATADRIAPAPALTRALVQCGIALAFAFVTLVAPSPRPGQLPAAATDLASPTLAARADRQSRAVGEDEVPPAGPQRTHPAKKPRAGKLQVQAPPATVLTASGGHAVLPQPARVAAAPARARAARSMVDRPGASRPHPALRLNPGQAPPILA